MQLIGCFSSHAAKLDSVPTDIEMANRCNFASSLPDGYVTDRDLVDVGVAPCADFESERLCRHLKDLELVS